jgi:AcrR family transcriptional regulator
MGLKPEKSAKAASAGNAAHPPKFDANLAPPLKGAPPLKPQETPPPAQKWRRRKEARPQEILTAALAVFAEKGFSAARVEDIAARAGISKGAVYLYYDSKQEMLRALVREGMIANLKSAGGMMADYEGSSADLLRRFLQTAVHAILMSPLAAVPKIIISESGNFPEIAEFYHREVIYVGLGLITRIIERGMARGEFRPLNAEHTAKLCIAPVVLTAIWKSCFDQFEETPFNADAFITQHLDIFLSGISVPDTARGT